MAYFVVEDAKFGMDRRRERVAGAPGTLWTAKNVHLTRGADIERRKKFIPEYNVAGTFGAMELRSQLYVFGSDDIGDTLPIGIRYQRLDAPDTPAMVAVLDAKSFKGKTYIIAEYSDGSVRHFYDSVRVTDWDVIGAANASFETVASLLAAKADASASVRAEASANYVTLTARTPGTAVTITATADGGGSTGDQTATVTTQQANVAAVAEVRAGATIEITGGSAGSGNYIGAVTVDGVALIGANVLWTGSNAATAINLASAITAGYSTHGYSAAALGAVVTISAAPGTGSAPNGDVLVVATYGDVSAATSGDIAGGVDEVEAVAQVVTVAFDGTFEADDSFSIVVDGVTYRATGLASGTGRTAFVDKQRVWSPAGSIWFYSMLNRADIWDPLNATPDNDAGLINVAAESNGNENLLSAARYEALAAVFSSDNIALYQLDVDPANFAFSSLLENTGTVAPKSPVRYGNNDVFYLDRTGIRSLKARDASNAPFISDIGNAIDTFVQEYVATLSQEEVLNGVAAIEPRDGRYWMVLGNRVFVLSYFPGAKVTGWSYYDIEEIGDDAVQAIVRIRSTIFLRAGDFIYAYGGLNGDQYPDDDEILGDIELPFLSAKTPASVKQFAGFDFAGTNVWEVTAAPDPNRPDATINVGRVSRITFADQMAIAMQAQSSMLAMRFRCSRAGPATLSMYAVHYDSETPG